VATFEVICHVSVVHVRVQKNAIVLGVFASRGGLQLCFSSMDEVDAFLEDEEDPLIDSHPVAFMELPDDVDPQGSHEQVDETSWLRPDMPPVNPEHDTIGEKVLMK
jgi:hypothetical protein